MSDNEKRIRFEVLQTAIGIVDQDLYWRKENGEAPLRFFYLDGVSEVSMVQGGIWMAIIPTLTRLSMR